MRFAIPVNIEEHKIERYRARRTSEIVVKYLADNEYLSTRSKGTANVLENALSAFGR